MSNYISYTNIIKDRDNFRKAGTRSGSEFNLFDSPGQKYFKIFFYFNNGDESGNQNIEAGNGLITPTWLLPSTNDSTYYLYNSAWSYLKMNNEDERADLLVDFVNLLSNISSESPWYFSEITGLDSALDRKVVGAENFTVEATRPKISIKCLPDSYDDRIGSLLDLYRAIVWSWSTKREILPANLRKFDMGILIFETPNEPFHKLKSHTKSFADSFKSKDNLQKTLKGDNIEAADYSVIGIGSSSDYVTSYKYIELHNCEIDYNSTKNLYSSLNNKDGLQVEYVIDIHFDDCYETRYNEFSIKSFGDLIQYDLLSGNQASKYIYPILSETKSDKSDQENKSSLWGQIKNAARSQFNSPNAKNSLEDRINVYDKGFVGNAVSQLTTTGVDMATGILKRAVLGNLYTFSLTKIQSQVEGLMSGNVLGAANNISGYVNNIKQRMEMNERKSLQNKTLFQKKKIQPTVKYIGKLAQGNTIANNI